MGRPFQDHLQPPRGAGTGMFEFHVKVYAASATALVQVFRTRHVRFPRVPLVTSPGRPP